MTFVNKQVERKRSSWWSWRRLQGWKWNSRVCCRRRLISTRCHGILTWRHVVGCVRPWRSVSGRRMLLAAVVCQRIKHWRTLIKCFTFN